jgi:cobalt-zinc-cadmium resistance protein CzcA
MGKELQDIPGITAGFQYPVQMRFNELMTGARQDVVVKIFGENMDTLAAYAAKLGAIVNTVEGAKDLYIEPVTGLPQIIIDYNRNTIAQYNLNIADINKVVNTAFAGQIAGNVYEGEKHFDLVVRLAGEKRQNIKDVQNLLIPTPNGNQIPLSQLADVSIQNGPNQIQREDAKRRIVVGFNVRGRDVKSIVQELQQKVNEQIKFPPAYYATYGGAFENLNAATQRLMIAVPVSLLLIFILLYFAFHSVKQGLLIYSAIPLSAIGGIFFLALRGMPFSISAGVGFIALFGIAVLNGIVLIAEFNRLKKEGMKNKKRIVLMGTKVRLRPVLMTAFVASLGFLPMALSNGAGAEVQRPLATVVIGGLMIATFLTLFVLPVLYIMFENIKPKKIKVNASVAMLFLFLIGSLFATNVDAQTPITLPAAIDTALKNNLSLKNVSLRETYQEKLIKTSAEIPATSVFAEAGQINSFYTDTKFGISQTINFPTVYARQKALLKEEFLGSKIAVSVKESELKRDVSELYNTLSYLLEKKKLLIGIDSIYSEFLNKANLRFQKGESNVLEKATAENQQGQIAIQLKQLQQDIEIAEIQFQLVLNTSTLFIPAEENFKRRFSDITISDLEQSPRIQFLQQQKQIASANTQFQKAKLSPDLILGYNNTSIRGIGADDKYYSASKRFHAVQVGVGIPLFNGAQKARINASKVNESIADNSYLLGLQTLQKEKETALIDYQKFLQTANWYEQTALKSAEVISSTATKQFVNGDINYLEWVMLTNQSVTIKSQYLDVIKSLNEAINQLNYLNNK